MRVESVYEGGSGERQLEGLPGDRTDVKFDNHHGSKQGHRQS
jgi:hypothetical protein